jgi:sugar fermentation stimulation protein A
VRFPVPLVRGTLLRRYKRFLADVELPSGDVVVAHVANPGSMLGLAIPGSPAWLALATDPARKLQYSLELIEVNDGRGPTLVGINTSRPNAIVAEALATGLVPELAGYAEVRREVPYGKNSRIDFLLTAPQRQNVYLEVKNAHLVRESGRAEFPDAVTARGTKHLHELAEVVAAGHRAVMLYFVHRGDCDVFDLARDIDPDYAAAFAAAREGGVEMLAYAAAVTTTGVAISHRIMIAA